jgi:tetratricopeptide (TPR) repeat protein
VQSHCLKNGKTYICRLTSVCLARLCHNTHARSLSSSLQVQLNQIQMCYGQVNTYLFILKMNGNYDKVNPFPEIFDGKITNEEELLQLALSSGKRINAKGILSNRFQVAFWLGKFDEAAELAEKAKPPPKMSFMEVYHIFCEGLTAFQLARRSSSPSASKWMAIGEEAVSRFRFYGKCSTWNWENNLFLLEAEYHHCKQEEDKANAKYRASIKSAQDHRFVHEEALAFEFYGDFLRITRRVDQARETYANACVCYEKWGAHAIIPRLQEKMGQLQGQGTE